MNWLPAWRAKFAFHNGFYGASGCTSNIEMTPLCKVEVTLPRVLGSRGMGRGGGVDEQEFSRLEVLLRVQSGRLRIADACELIGLQRRQVFRLLRGFKQDGATSLLSKRRGKPSNNRLPSAVRTLALSIVRDRYADFGPTLAAEKLDSNAHGCLVAPDPAQLDDRRWTVAGSPSSSPLAASAAPTARLPGRTGADRRLRARLVRGSRPAVHAAGFRG